MVMVERDQMRVCEECLGDGQLEDLPGHMVTCFLCDGAGVISIEGMKRPVAMNLRTIPLELRKRFKAYCALKGYTMEERIKEMITEEIKS